MSPALPPTIRSVIDSLSRVLGQPDTQARASVVWLFAGTDNLERLRQDAPALHARYPAERWQVTVVLPARSLQPWALPDIRPLLGPCEVLEVNDAGFARLLRDAQDLAFEVQAGGRHFVQLPQRRFVGAAMARLLDEEDRQDYVRQDALAAPCIADGIVHPLRLSATAQVENRQYGGVTDAALRWVPQSATPRVASRHCSTPLADWYVGADPACQAADIAQRDEEVVFLGALSRHYGHFVLEGLARLWFMLPAERARLKAVYIAEPGPDPFLELFGFFGLQPQQLEKITQPTRFRAVWVPEPALRLQDRCHPLYKAVIDRILAAVPASAHRRVYFSKEMRGNCRGIGEKPMEEVFAANGYQVFFPERLSMRDTLSVLKGCEVFAASSGTNAHNALWLPDGARSIVLNRSPHAHPVQTMIDRLKQLDAVYVDADAALLPASWSTGPFLFGPTQQLLAFYRYHRMAHQPEALRARFVPHLLDYLRTWAVYYGDPRRRQHIDPAETTLDFDALVAAANATYTELAAPPPAAPARPALAA